MSKRHRPARQRQAPDRLTDADRQRLETAFKLATAKDRQKARHATCRRGHHEALMTSRTAKDGNPIVPGHDNGT